MSNSADEGAGTAMAAVELLKLILNSETDKTKAGNTRWILQTYRTCLRATRGLQPREPRGSQAAEAE